MTDISKWRVSLTERYGDAATGGTKLTIWCPREEARRVRQVGGKLNCGLDVALVKFQGSSGKTQLGKPPGMAAK